MPLLEPYNHNDHYHPLLLSLVPDGATTALDVGCGTGALAGKLAAVGLSVTALDADGPALGAAPPTEGVSYLHGDVMELPLGTYDFVTAVAVLHHLDLGAGLARLQSLVAPGGRLAVLGIRRRTLLELPWDVVAVAVSQTYARTRAYVPMTAPALDPTTTFADIRRAAPPAARMRRLLLFRYLLTWDRPA